MGLVSYTNLENNTPADANGINQRFGGVLEQVNGNLDSTNIRKGSITRELLSQDALSAAWPVNSVHISISSTNPSSYFGGTWVMFGQGRTLMGVDEGQSEFEDVEQEGGEKDVTLSEAQMPSHYHPVNPPSTSTTTDSHSHRYGRDVFYTSGGGNRRTYAFGNGQQMAFGNPSTSSDSHSHTVNIPSFNSSSRGSGEAHNNLAPYVTVYFFKRVA